MAITPTWKQLSGKLIPQLNMEKTETQGISNEVIYDFYRYSFEVPFTPQENAPIEGISFVDIHGNKYNTADLVVCEKLDVGCFYSSSQINKPSIKNMKGAASPLNLTEYGTINPLRSFTVYGVDVDPFAPFTPEVIPNATDGFDPFSPVLPVNASLTPIPAFLGTSSGDDVTVYTLDTLKAGTADESLYLMKLNNPYFLVSGGSGGIGSWLMRIVLFAKPFSARP